ncbi:prolyl oligopeptidase family serine peptidase [Microbacterium terrisoli]|uniref:prolyl oligopeptidase family serine peptidase n=1 Tax=Microbacterium terrisoli TaxID=3242192 RepID=UPI002805ACBD|nr:prolyl oligopeptidase family serine peptidase [Microbacterium protaetiae]
MHDYPSARRSDVHETLHGEVVADPYRWLEDADAPETQAFVAAQNAHARPALDALSSRTEFLETVTEMLTAPARGCPFEKGGRVFAWHGDGQNQDVLVVADSVDELENGRVLLDPNTLSDDGTSAVTTASVSPDGALLAYGVADGGSDWRTIRVRDVETGQDLDDEITWTKWNSPVWLPATDQSADQRVDTSVDVAARSFSYWCYDEPDGNALTSEQGAGRLQAHVVGTDRQADAVLFSRPDEPRTFARPWPADDTWFVLHTDSGSSSGNDLAVRRHAEPVEALRALVTGRDREWHSIGIRDDVLYVVTDDGAARYRLASFDLNTGAQSTVVAEHDEDVLLNAHLTATGLMLEYSHDAAHRAQLAAFDGTLGEALPLGEGVSITGMSTDDESGRVYATTSSFVDRGTRHILDVDGTSVLSHRTLPTPGPAAPRATTSRIRVTSTDGADVPAFVVRPEGDDGSVPRPTLIWGYGGFNIPMNPGFRAVLAAWVAASGVLVVPNLRGGGEFGSDWHHAGTKERKQQVFDDLYAVAEHLVSTGVTTRRQLALHGRSNGGLLAGAALTQRPELWAAVLPGVGVLDMLRFDRFTIGWAWTSDYGDPDEADAFAYLKAYSPLHNVRPGTEYPPTLITTGDHDDRVVPGHSLKFAAALQHAQAADAPILLAVDTRAGHGMGKPKDAAAAEFADQLAFAAHHTGLR